MKKRLLGLCILPMLAFAGGGCKLINAQCIDSSPSKNINGVIYYLSDACNKLGLSESQCCWQMQSSYYCGDAEDACLLYRNNDKCRFKTNTCIESNTETGGCKLYQSTYECADSFMPTESILCTSAVCVNYNNNSESSPIPCFLPNGTKQQQASASQNNIANLATALTWLEIGKQEGDELSGCNNNPESCMLFTGKYRTCDIWNGGNPLNNGSDCMIHNSFFSVNSNGENISDKAIYGSVTSSQTSFDGSSSSPDFNYNGNGYRVGDRWTYHLSHNRSDIINSSVNRLNQNGMSMTNSDMAPQLIPNANPNATSNSMSLVNGEVANVTINNNANNKVGIFGQYLTAGSVKLAWDRVKSSPDPNNSPEYSWASLGVTHMPQGNPYHWGGDNRPVVQGLCMYLDNYCNGQYDITSGYMAVNIALLGNPDACADCVLDNFGICEPENITVTTKSTKEEWCCFSSQIALDINLAAYDQGVINLYKTNNIQPHQPNGNGYVVQNNGSCGGLTVTQIQHIDFSKANYFNNFTNSIESSPISNVMNMNAISDPGVQGRIQGRGEASSIQLINNRQQP